MQICVCSLDDDGDGDIKKIIIKVRTLMEAAMVILPACVHPAESPKAAQSDTQTCPDGEREEVDEAEEISCAGCCEVSV